MSWEITSILTAGKYLGLTLGVSLLVAVLVGLIYGFLYKPRVDAPARKYGAVVATALPFVFLLAIVGGLTGQLSGASRESIAGSILPALFAAFGGYIAYFLGAKKDRSGKIAVNTLAFLLAFFVLYNVAATWRQSNEAFDFCKGVFSDPAFSTEELRADRNEIWNTYCGSAFALFSDISQR